MPARSVLKDDFHAFYQAHFEKVRASVQLYCGSTDAAFDATQEAFIRAYLRWGRLRSESWPVAWVTVTAFNHAKRIMRRRRSQPSQDDSDSQVQLGSSSSAERVDVSRALAQLPRKQREVAILYYIHDLPTDAVANELGMARGTVKSHLSRAREALRPLLEVGG